MKAHVLTGPKEHIAETVARMEGDVREAIVFVNEPTDRTAAAECDIFAEMTPFEVSVGDLDDSRESLYTRQAGE